MGHRAGAQRRVSLVTTSDVARLAKVSRPVVTMWRTRYVDSTEPFPPSVGTRNGAQLFELDAVAAWLRSTNRGNNSDVAGDLDRFRPPDDEPVLPPERLLSCTAIVAVLKASGAPSEECDPAAMVASAHDLDPDDRFLFREIRDSGTRVSDLRHLTTVADATYGIEDLYDAACGEPLQKFWPPIRDTRLAATTADLVVRLVRALLPLGGPEAVVVDRTGSGPLLLSITGPGTEIVMAPGDSVAERFTRQLLTIHDREWRLSAPGDPVPAGVHLVELPAPSALGASQADQMALVAATADAMGAHSTAVAIGPASLLVDRVTGLVARERDDLIRSGTLRCVIRLPAGGRVSRPREHLGIWVLSHPATEPVEAQVLHVADLSGAALTEPLIAGIVDDVLAVTSGLAAARGRAWVGLRPIRRLELLAGSGSLVRAPRGKRTTQVPDAELVLSLTAADRWGALGSITAAADAPARTGPDVTIAEAIAAGWVRHLSGSRVDPTTLPSGATPVIGSSADDGIGPMGASVDLLTLLASTPAHTTQAGDVVFTAGRRPASWVDRAGGSLVLTPAHVLRILPGAPLSPHAVASRIAAAPPGSRWRSWALTPVPQPDALDAALRELDQAERRLQAEIAQLRGFRDDLITAVERHHLMLAPRKDDPHGSYQAG